MVKMLAGNPLIWGSLRLRKKHSKVFSKPTRAEAFPLRVELMSLRLELRHLIRDPNVQPKILLDRQKKISELQAKLNDLSLSYQIKARSIFTKEQFAKFPQDCSLEMEVGYGMGVLGGKDHIRR